MDGLVKTIDLLGRTVAALEQHNIQLQQDNQAQAEQIEALETKIRELMAKSECKGTA